MKNTSYNDAHKRLKDLKGPFIYNGTKYKDLTELSLAEGADRDKVIMLYLTTDWSIGEVIHIASCIELLN